jgi:small subunit ribosomal protein S1
VAGEKAPETQEKEPGTAPKKRRRSSKRASGRRSRRRSGKAVSAGTQEPLPTIVVAGRVVGLVKGGFEVDTPLGPGLCSSGQIGPGKLRDASSFLGKDLDFEILSAQEGRLRLSHRRVAEREANRHVRALRDKIRPGMRLRGRVVRLTEFGAFVDLGGVEGMVHVSEISHRRVEDPADELAVGQDVEVEVLRAPRGDTDGASRPRGGGRISLSIKATLTDPWDEVEKRFPLWTVADGRIERVTEFGAFVEIAPGVEGLLHDQELPRGALARLAELVGDVRSLACLVVEVDRKRRRVGLAPAPAGLEAGARIEPLRLRNGQVVEGPVESVEPGAVLVRLGPGQLGVIPNAEMGTERGTDHRTAFPPGTRIEAEVTRVEAGGRRARISRKRAQRKAERAEIERYARTHSDVGLSTLGDLLKQAEKTSRD